MARYAYDCIIVKDEDGYTVNFPQLPGCFTDGATREDAITNAAEALQTYMADFAEQDIQPPEYEHSAEIVNINIEITDAKLEEMRYMPQAAAADLLGVTVSRVSALIKNGKLASKWFDGRREVSIESVKAYAASPRKSGRPAKTVA